MKTSAIRSLRRKLASDETVFGLWVTLESPSITEMAVALGLDWVVIDAEHGHLDWKEIVEHVRAAVRSETVVLVRIADEWSIDQTCAGYCACIVIPWIENAEQLNKPSRSRGIRRTVFVGNRRITSDGLGACNARACSRSE